jgi:hypothetical protein
VLSGPSKGSLARAIAEVLEPVDTPEAREALRAWRLRS